MAAVEGLAVVWHRPVGQVAFDETGVWFFPGNDQLIIIRVPLPTKQEHPPGA